MTTIAANAATQYTLAEEVVFDFSPEVIEYIVGRPIDISDPKKGNWLPEIKFSGAKLGKRPLVIKLDSKNKFSWAKWMEATDSGEPDRAARIRLLSGCVVTSDPRGYDIVSLQAGTYRFACKQVDFSEMVADSWDAV